MKTKIIAICITSFCLISSFAFANPEDQQHEEIAKIFTPSGGVQPSHENKKIVANFYEYLEKNDVTEIKKLLAGNFQFYDASAAYDSDYSKYDAMSKSVGVRVKALHQALPDFKLSVLEMIGEGNKVVARVMISGLQKGEFLGISPTNKPVAIKTFAIFTIEDGKISSISELWNELSVMKQIGYIIL
ncbi:MAG: ester cyclase [Simkaniaceae bacterium]|nr:ester cyclase [Simkaniaceae bacterium]